MSAEIFKYTFNDIVTVSGGGSRRYVVECYRQETTFYIDETMTDKVYELTCLNTGEFAEVEEDEIIEKVGEYDESDWDDDWDDDDDVSSKLYYTIQFDTNEEATVMKLTPREESAREAERRKQERKEKAAQTDALLDEFNDYKALFEKFGDMEYAEQMAHTLAKLTELNA